MNISRQFKENFTAIGFFVVSVFVVIVCLVVVLNASQINHTAFGVLLTIFFSVLLLALLLFGAYQIFAIVVRARAERDKKPPSPS